VPKIGNDKLRILGLSEKQGNASEMTTEQIPWKAVNEIAILNIRLHHVPDNRNAYSDYHSTSK